MARHIELGRKGEALAAVFLEKKGYKILEKNFRKPWGELDLVALASDKTLVFIEVKTMRPREDIRPEDQLTAAKKEKFSRVASLYAGAHPELVSDKCGWRLDLVAIDILENSEPDIRHYENI